LHILLKFSRLVDAISEFLGNLANYVVILVILIGFYNVMVRYAGRYIGVQLSSNVYIELQWYLFSIIFFLGFAYILKHGVNVRVDFLYAQWDEKRRALVDFWGSILFLIPFSLIGLLVTYTPVWRSWVTWEMSPDANGLPRAPIKSMIIVAFVMLLLQSIAQAIKNYAVLRGENKASELLQVDPSGQPAIE
jgi:TRAP-type mannitol/chloroaromatic compound transport system permease small subunit